MHSFRTHVDGSITWVPHRRDPPPAQLNRPPKKNRGDEPTPTEGELSNRAQKRNDRARNYHALMAKAASFRCAIALRRWRLRWQDSVNAASQPPPGETEDGISGPGIPSGAGNSAIPSRRIHGDDAAHMPELQGMPGDEHFVPPDACMHGHQREDDERAADKRAHTSPAAGASSPAVRAPAKARRALAPADIESHGAAEEGRRAQASMTVCTGTAQEGGATQQLRMLPPCQPETPSNPPGSREGWQGPPGASAPCVGPQQMLAHLRMHEYPAFMNYHAQQGVPQGQAIEMWQVYEYRRMTEGHVQL